MRFDHPETFSLVTRVKTGTDGDGNDVYGPTEVAVTGAFAPEGSTELIQGQATLITNPTVYLEDGSPIPKATDQIRVRGLLYDIDGEPRVYHNPFTGEEPGAVLRLERVTG